MKNNKLRLFTVMLRDKMMVYLFFSIQVMWMLKNKIKINQPMFICFLSSLGQLSIQLVSLTTPHDESGLDDRVVGRMHYYKVWNGNQYYDDRMSSWFYDHVCLAKGNSPSQVEAIYQYNLQEEAELEAGSDMNKEDADNEEDKGALIMSHLHLALL